MFVDCYARSLGGLVRDLLTHRVEAGLSQFAGVKIAPEFDPLGIFERRVTVQDVAAFAA
jgi:hypothetical protein